MSATPDRKFSEETRNRAAGTIRPACIDDLHEIAIIWRDGQVAQGIDPPDLDLALNAFRARLESKVRGYGVWVAEIEGMLVGWQSLQPCRTSPLYHWAESSTYISTQSWGRGVGRRLLAFATEHAKAVRLSHVVGFIRKGNEAPIKIVESLGWQKVGVFHDRIRVILNGFTTSMLYRMNETTLLKDQTRVINNSVQDGVGTLVTIRPASIEDLHEISIIWMDGQVAQGYEPPDLSQVLDIFRPRLELQTDVYKIWVAEIEGAIVGWQSLHACRSNPLWKWAESSTYIARRSRGLGVGRKLLAFVTEYAKSVNLSHVVGVIIKGNEAPIKIVESLGWQKVGTIPRSNSSNTEWLYYVYAVLHE